MSLRRRVSYGAIFVQMDPELLVMEVEVESELGLAWVSDLDSYRGSFIDTL